MGVERIEIEKGSVVLILEDLPDRQKIFTEKLAGCVVIIVDNVADAIGALDTPELSAIFLDHDLDGRNGVPFDDPNCGSRVAEYLAANNSGVPVIIQSLNPAGAGNMKKILPEAVVMPAAWDRIVVV
jgi:CheY-like chemotaxis protein